MNMLVKQHNTITEARYDMSALEKNIIYLLLGLLNETDAPNKTYRIARKDLKEEKGKAMNHVYFSNSIKNLTNRRIYTQYRNNKQLFLNILSAGRYNQGAIELEISNEMRAFLFDLKNNFTLFNSQVALNLKSKYSKRLYEMLSQFKDTGEWFITVDELKARLFLFDEKTGAEKYPVYGLFRTRILEMAQKELAENADISFTYEAKKTGRKYTDLAFKIKYDRPLQVKSTKPLKIEAPQQKQDKYPHSDLSGDTLKGYIYMTKEVKWLDSKMAYKVVKTLTPTHLWNCISKYQMMVRRGGDEDLPRAKDFFQQILDNFLTNPKVRPTWSICYNKMFTDFRLSAIILEKLKEAIEQKTNPEDLLDFLGRLSKEMEQEDIPKIQKRSYVKKRLIEEFELAL